MNPIGRGRRRLLVGAILALPSVGCRSKPADVGEVFSTRTLALTYLERGQLPEAEAQFKKLIALVPDDPLGYADLGLTYLQSERYREAELQLRRARKLDPANADVGLLLAKLYSLTGRADDARATLEQLRRDTTANARVLYALAQMDAQRSDSVALHRYQELLKQVLAVAPANLAVRLELIGVLVRRALADSAVQQLEEVRRIPPEPPREARSSLESALRLLQAGELAAAKGALDHFVDLVEVTSPYQASLNEVKWAEGPLAGRPVLTFAPTSLITLAGVREKATFDSVQFLDVTDEAGLFGPRLLSGRRGALPTATTAPTALAAGDVDGDGDDDLLVSFRSPAQRTSAVHLYYMQGGFARDMTGQASLSLPGGASFATFADVDNDGWLDLFVISDDGSGHLLRNTAKNSFEDMTAKSGITVVKGEREARFVDLDHDGDLDLLLFGNGAFAVYRNNLDGTFTEGTANFGLAGTAAASDAAFGDVDGDGRIDLVLTSDQSGTSLFHNGGAQRFSDATSTSGITNDGGSGAVAIGDYNNDGSLDVFVASTSGSAPALWLNKGNGTFTLDRRSASAFQPLRSVAGTAADFMDYDNDGWLDLVVVGKPRAAGEPGSFLLRNKGNGTFADRSVLLPLPARQGGGTRLVVTDIDEDGDEDLLVTDGEGTLRLLRNNGGNSNMSVRVELKALRTGSGKNNVFGIGARLELRAGEIYQTRVVNRRETHFGLGPHLKADVLRVEWPNGVPQTVYLPGSDQSVVESEMLKGSCAFAYAWDGTGFHFVTDVMWRSALGMPLGLMGGGTTSRFAPAGASQEYLRIPGSALRPRDGRYVLQLTEELWESAYTDEIKLLAVDHPDSVDVFVDERFVPPGPVQLRLFQVVRPQAALAASDDRGTDLLPALRASDARYVSNLTPMQYQGVVERHDLILDLGEGAGRAGTFLFLRGWIYPTDASINVALSQQSKVKLAAPSLEVRAHGQWVTAIPDIGFPSGKDKTIVVALEGKFPTSDHRVRLRTNMQIYWDQAFVAGDAATSPVKITTLAPLSADLHRRGFSRTYRKGGRYGPYWFNYDDVSKDSPWRPIDGAFTRFGDVLPLLKQPDDMYVVMGPGDETTVQFDAASASALPPGWTRDFLLYTDGWIKDSDLNTALGTTVGPLPFHRMKEYPYAPGDAYPTDAEHQQYLRAYNTRSSQPR